MSRRGGRRSRWGREAGAVPAPTPPTVTWSTPADGASVDWGDSSAMEVSVTPGSGSITGVTWKLGSGTPEALSYVSGTKWLATHTWTLAEVGASQTITATATTSDGLSVDATRTITVVDPFVALSVTHWRLDENTTIFDASASANVATWDVSNVTNALESGDVYTVTESTDGVPTTHLTLVNYSGFSAGRAWFAIAAKAGARGYVYVVAGAEGYVNLSTGATTGVTGGTITTADLGDGWWQILVKSDSTGTGNGKVYPSNGTSGVNYTGNGSVAIRLRGLTTGEAAAAGVTGVLTQRRASQVSARTGSYGTFAQATGQFQPFLWNGSAWSQSDGLNFAGSEFMIAGSGNSAQPDTVGVVWNATSAAGSYGVYSGGTTTAGALTTASTLISIRAGSTVSTGQAPTTATQVDVTRYDGASSWNRHNGSQTADLDIGTTARGGGLAIGLINGTPYLTGMIKDVFYKSGGLSASEAARCEKALAQLRGITLA